MTKAASQVAAGFVRGIGIAGLILGDFLGRVVGLAGLWWRGDLSLRRRSDLSIWTLARRYREFGLLSGPAAIVNSTGRQLTPLLIAGLFGMEVAGWFGLAQRVVAVPLALLGQAIAQVYIGAVGRLARQDPRGLRRLYWRVSWKLLLVGVVPLAMLAAGGPPLFEWVFGPAWGEVGTYTRILVTMYVAQFVVFPLSQTLNILQRHRWQLAFDAGRLLAVAGAVLGVASLGVGPRATLMAYGAVMTCSYGVLFVLGWLAIARLCQAAPTHEGTPS